MSSSGHHHYKDLCSELKLDLKRKKRELDDADDRLRRCEADAKKAKLESQEVLKLYHGLQRELQLAYERNAKLQVDKVSFEALLDSERKDFEAFKRQHTVGADENKKLKDALCAMKTEKLELETKFNAIVMENKDLRDRARQYEPRLREVDEIKRKLAQVERIIGEQVHPEIRAQNERAQGAQVRQEQLDRYAKWNALLKREVDEKSQQLKRYDELVAFARRLEDDKAMLQAEVEQLKSVIGRDADKLVKATLIEASHSRMGDIGDGQGEQWSTVSDVQDALALDEDPLRQIEAAVDDGHQMVLSDDQAGLTLVDDDSESDGQVRNVLHADSTPVDQIDHAPTCAEPTEPLIARVVGASVTSDSEQNPVVACAASDHALADFLIHLQHLRSLIGDLKQNVRLEVAELSSQLFNAMDRLKNSFHSHSDHKLSASVELDTGTGCAS